MANDVVVSGSASVTAGAGSVVVSGVFGSSSYLVGVSPSWATAWGVPSKTSSAFTVTFSMPAPANATIDYTVMLLS